VTARQCLALQIYVIAVVRYLETPSPAFARLMEADKRQLEDAFGAKAPVSYPDLLTAPEPAPPALPDWL
jgi:hypothetical protein